jgi:hypothetical protein
MNAEEYSSLNAACRRVFQPESRNAEEYSSLNAACRKVLQPECRKVQKRVLKSECSMQKSTSA